MSKSIRRKSAQALAKKVWNMVLKNKDQTKSSRSKISDDDSSNEVDRHTLSISSDDSSQSQSQLADPDAFVKEDDGSSCSIDTVEATHDGAEHVKHDDSSSDAGKENVPLLETALQVNSDESAHETEGKTRGGDGKADSEERLEILTLKDNASDGSRSTLSQSQGIDEASCVEELNKDNSFVVGAAVHIIKGTNIGKCGIISRVTSKCVFISISGFNKDVRKTKSNEFLQLSNQKRICNKKDDSGPQEIFLQGNWVRIKKGVHHGCHGIISRTTEKCVFISIRGFPKDVRKKKSAEFLRSY